VLAVVNEKKIDILDFPITPVNLGKLINLINDGTISGKIAKEVFNFMLIDNSNPELISKRKNLIQISDTSEIELIN
jgi:Asp-tRNAAsn/Glu-tRNAGln amidotransferase B subunit (PET112 homolog)